MSYNPNGNLYNPQIKPDTQGMAPGIMSATGSLTSAFTTISRDKREDSKRQESRQWQLEDQIAAYGQQEKLMGLRQQGDMQKYGMIREAQLADYGMQREDKKADKEMERQMELENKIAHYGTIGVLLGKEGHVDPEVLEYALSLPPKGRAAALETIVGQGSYKAQAKLKREQALQTYPIPQTDTYQMTGNGMMVPPKPAPVPTLTPEQMEAYGLKPDTVKVGGVTYKAPQPAPLPRLKDIVDPKTGAVTWYDPFTGRPGGASAPPQTVEKYFQK